MGIASALASEPVAINCVTELWSPPFQRSLAAEVLLGNSLLFPVELLEPPRCYQCSLAFSCKGFYEVTRQSPYFGTGIFP